MEMGLPEPASISITRDKEKWNSKNFSCGERKMEKSMEIKLRNRSLPASLRIYRISYDNAISVELIESLFLFDTNEQYLHMREKS